MEKKVFFILVIIGLSVIPDAYSQTITANALFEGKVVLLVNGKTLFLSSGQKKQGIKLIEATEHKAIIEVDGRRKTLFLDKTIAKQYASPTDWERNITSKSHVIAARMIHQTRNIATFEVDYYFNDKGYDYATLSAKTLFNKNITEYWAHTYTRLQEGRNLVTITISMNSKSPETYASDAIQFDINWVKGSESGVIGSKVIEFIKEWDR